MKINPKIPRKNKKQYKIDNITYKNKTLYEFHMECSYAINSGYINSFEVPEALSSKSRYTTYKPTIDNIRFDSMMEARFYIKLCRDKKEGRISDFKMQVPFNLQPKFRKNGKAYRAIDYVSDFVIYNDDKISYVVDIKGKETVEFKIKHKLFEYRYPEYELKVIQYYESEQKWLELDEIKKIIRNKKKNK